MAKKRQTRNPFQGVTDFFSEMNRMSSVMYGKGESERRTESSAWAPLTDIKADGDDLVICCELPGVDKANIHISLINGVLTINGSRETSDHRYYVRERFHGNFRRTVSLPDNVDDGDISAAFRNGLLIVTVANAAVAAKPREIDIMAEDDDN